MSMTSGLIAIKGEHLDKLPEILAFYERIDTEGDQPIENWDKAWEIVHPLREASPDDTSEKHMVGSVNGWTIIEDFDHLMSIDEDALLKISQHLSTPVFSLMTQGTSNCWGFWYFDKVKRRSFYNEDGVVTDNFGEPLAEEAGFNLNEDGFYDDIHGVAKNFGIDWEGMFTAENMHAFIIKKLDYEGERRQEALALLARYYANKAEEKKMKKPWWKIWA